MQPYQSEIAEVRPDLNSMQGEKSLQTNRLIFNWKKYCNIKWLLEWSLHSYRVCCPQCSYITWNPTVPYTSGTSSHLHQFCLSLKLVNLLKSKVKWIDSFWGLLIICSMQKWRPGEFQYMICGTAVICRYACPGFVRRQAPAKSYTECVKHTKAITPKSCWVTVVKIPILNYTMMETVRWYCTCTQA